MYYIHCLNQQYKEVKYLTYNIFAYRFSKKLKIMSIKCKY